ncbi:hypothetical protein BXZ70DRAFT_1011487 [Cristinia sonorae]|uniref:BTB domain-containing protein n=1 Tax=Cristinia sonorae TaxID=1940300 RepID=A0A8K0XLJ5_9AGAR|nr:hypothetical protein BXZ70DRAFT_1011487 [Cristinia sonorae]
MFPSTPQAGAQVSEVVRSDGLPIKSPPTKLPKPENPASLAPSTPSPPRVISQSALFRCRTGQPFDLLSNSDGCVILQSRNNVTFYTLSFLLKVASPVLWCMISSGQFTSPSKTIGGVQAHTIPELDDQAMEIFLLPLYPVVTSQLFDVPLRVIFDALRAAKKYQVPAVVRVMHELLEKTTRADAHVAFALACKWDMEQEARLAARRILTIRLDSGSGATCDLPYIPEMDDITAGSHHRLLKYVFADGGIPANQPFIQPSRTPHAAPAPSSCIPCAISTTYDHLPPDLLIRSILEGPDIPAHTALLTIASPYFAQRIRDSTEKSATGLTVLSLPQSRNVLRELVERCYGAISPSPDAKHEDIADVAFAVEVAHVAVCYQMTKVLTSTNFSFDTILERDPLSVYLAAVKCGWREKATEAARRACKIAGEHPYVKDMEDAPAKSYHRFLQFRNEVRKVATLTIEKFSASNKSNPHPTFQGTNTGVAQFGFSFGHSASGASPLTKSVTSPSTLFSPIPVMEWGSRVHYGVSLPASLSESSIESLKSDIDSAIMTVVLQFD